MSLPSYALNQPSFPEMYERWLVDPLRPWAELTLEEINAAPEDRILDIACGTGIVARVARERLQRADRIVGVDVSSNMLAVARTVAPDIDWRQGNAISLPLKDEEVFDLIVCQQGLQFIPDKAAAVAQMRRALAPGGRLAVATWRSDDEVPFFRDLRLVAEAHVGAIADQRYGYGNPEALEELLRGAKFHHVRSRTLSRTIRFGDGTVFVRLNAMALVGMSTSAKGMTDEQRKRIVETIVSESAPVLQSYTGASGLAFELRTNLATAKG